MKVLVINTSEKNGGAAIAANRLVKALRRNKVSVKMLVRDRQTNDSDVVALRTTVRTKWQFVWERFVIWLLNNFDKKRLFQISLANTGTDITKLKDFKEADVLHIHWINQGMLSLNDIDHIIKSGKPVVWTMHDMWPFTGICHYNEECTNFLESCGECPFLCSKSGNDVSHKLLEKKRNIYNNANIAFVACSKWLRDIARSSNVLKEKNVINIPNTIDTELFNEKEKKTIRDKYGLPNDKKLLLFGSAKISEKRKGFSYLIEACDILLNRYPELCKDLGVIILGKYNEGDFCIPLPTYSMNYIKNEKELCDIYNAADVYVTPSLQDNLPNTIMEALACGLPCVGFNVGGIPEMIEHKVNGYISEYKSSQDLAEGIRWILQDAQYPNLQKQAVKKVVECYSDKIVVKEYLQIYNSLTNKCK
ncbi:MAG: glycosyltransferase family 4 protein [Bacteroidaceae bacterium]|nr:glycosyltransferase family 4 protein [Bacteroidaceae bacterium]